MKRSIVTAVGAAMAASLALTGCGTSGGSTASSNKPVTLTMAGWTLSTAPEFKAIANGFHAANPKVTVELRAYDTKTYDTQMMAELAAAKAPDVLVQKNLQHFLTYQSGNQLLDVSDVAKKLRNTVKGLASCTVNGKTYAIPYRQDSWLLFYNKDLFDKAGVAYPDGSWTWEDYAKAAKRLTAGLKTAKSTALGAYQHPWQSTVQGFALAQTPDADMFRGDFSYLKPHYQRVLDLQKSGAQVSLADATAKRLTYQEQFGKQQAAMMLMGTWYIGALLNQQSNGVVDTFRWGMAPAPQLASGTTGTSKTPVTFGDPTALAINPSISKEKIAAAKALVAWTASPEGAKVMATVGIYPADDTAITDIFFANKGMPTDSLSRFTFTTHETRPENPVSKYTAGLQTILSDLHTSILSGNKDLDTAVTDAQARAREAVLNK